MKKRILSAILAIAMVATLLVAVPVTAATHNSTKISVIPDKTTAKVGDIINCTVSLGPVSEMGSMQMQLVFPDSLSYVPGSGKLADGLMEKLGYDTADWTEESLVINGFASAADYESDKDTTLATFQCRVEDGFVGTAKIDLTYLEFYSCQTFEDHTARYTAVPAEIKIEGVSVAAPTLTVAANKDNAKRGDEITYTVYMQQTDTITCFAFYVKAADGLTFVDNSVTLSEGAKKLFGETFEYTSPKDTVDPEKVLPYFSWYSVEGEDVTNKSKIELAKFKCTVDDDADLDKLYEVALEEVVVGAGSTQNFADISALAKVTPHFVYVTTPTAPSTPSTPQNPPAETPDDKDDNKDDENVEDKPQTPATPSNPFKDVANGVYYFDPVLWAVENNITSGTSETTFSPDLSCTRGQTVTFLWRAAGCPTPTLTENPFTDVAPGSYYYDAVLWAVEKGITTGMTETTFAPDATVNRAQTVTFLWRSAAKPEVSAANPFTDVKAGEYFEKAVLWAASDNITTGTSATAFSPNNECTRGQIVTFIYRLYNK